MDLKEQSRSRTFRTTNEINLLLKTDMPNPHEDLYNDYDFLFDVTWQLAALCWVHVFTIIINLVGNNLERVGFHFIKLY